MRAAQKTRASARWIVPPLLLLAGAASPAAPVPRTPEALAASARAHSPRARAAALESLAAERSAEGAGAFFDPMLAARVAPLSVPGMLPVDPREAMPFGAEVMLSQRLPLSGRLSREEERARALFVAALKTVGLPIAFLDSSRGSCRHLRTGIAREVECLIRR